MPKQTRSSAKSIPVLIDVAPKGSEWSEAVRELCNRFFGAEADLRRNYLARVVPRMQEIARELIEVNHDRSDKGLGRFKLPLIWFREISSEQLGNPAGKGVTYYRALIIEAIQKFGLEVLYPEARLPTIGPYESLAFQDSMLELRRETQIFLSNLTEIARLWDKPARLEAVTELQRILDSLVPKQHRIGDNETDWFAHDDSFAAHLYCGQLLLWRQVKPAILRFRSRGLSVRQAVDRVVKFYELDKDTLLNFLNLRDDLTPRGKAHMSVEEQAAISASQDLRVSKNRLRNRLSRHRSWTTPGDPPDY